jgi:hypothetical protein
VGKTKDYEIGICCFYAALRCKSKDWLTQIHDNRIFTDNNSDQFGNYLTDFGKKGPYFLLGMRPTFGSKIRGAKTLHYHESESASLCSYTLMMKSAFVKLNVKLTTTMLIVLLLLLKVVKRNHRAECTRNRDENHR